MNYYTADLYFGHENVIGFDNRSFQSVEEIGCILRDSNSIRYFESIEKMCFVKDGREKVVLCHFFIAEWNGYYRGARHIYGYIHNKKNEPYQYMRQKEKALDAGCMINQYMPASLSELIKNNARHKKIGTETSFCSGGGIKKPRKADLSSPVY